MRPPGGLHTEAAWLARGPVRTRVVVVGSGAGGANVTLRLAELGVEVLLLEAGPRLGPDDFSQEEAVALPQLYDEHGLRVARGPVPVPVLGARVLGGSTVVNSAICFPTPTHVLTQWRDRHGLAWADPEAFAPYLQWVWRFMEVRPTPPPFLGRHNEVTATAFQAMGWRWDWIPRNAPGCVGCGVCQYGCPAGGKRSVDRAQIPEALRHGATVVVEATVTRVLVARGRALGVEGRVRVAGRLRRFTVLADAVVLAAGAIRSPMLLQASGLGGVAEGTGRGLKIHPAIGLLAEFPEERIEIWRGATQGVFSDEFLHEGVLYESSTLPPVGYFSLVARAGRDPWPELARYPHVALAGAMLHDEALGSVEVGTDDRARIRYRLAGRDLERFRWALEQLALAYLRAGARAVRPTIPGAPWLDAAGPARRFLGRLREEQLFLYGSHPQATLRMDADPRRGVVSPGFHLWRVPNLYVADASIFPDCIGVNPQVTIMACARLAAEHVAQRL